MSKMKSVIAGLSVVAGLGVASLPLVAYADDPVVNNNPNQVTANIGSAISITLLSSGSGSTSADQLVCTDPVRSPAVSCAGDEQFVRTSLNPSEEDKTSMYTDIYVSTNSAGGYILTLTDSDTDNTLRIANTDYTIASIDREPVATTYPGWAVRIDDGDEDDTNDVWHQVPISTATPLTIKTVINPNDVTVNDHSKVFYGVATSSSQADGTYRGTVTYTATTRNNS